MKKIILTGGPCCGKTTLIDHLYENSHNRKYKTIVEVARNVIHERREFSERQYVDNELIDVISKEEGNIRQEMIYERQKRLEDATYEAFIPENLIIQDRGLIDNFAYCELFNWNPPKEMWEMDLQNRYDQVFILDQFPFEKDEDRIENSEQALQIHNKMFEVYERYGYSPIKTPIFYESTKEEGIGKRVEFIWENIK